MTEEQKLQIRLLRGQGIGYKQIGDVIGVTRDCVRSYCRNHGLAGHTPAVKMNIKERIASGDACEFCGEILKNPHTGRRRRFCSDECRMNYWKGHRAELKKNPKAIYTMECPYCHKTFESYGNKTRKYCCHEYYIMDRFGKENIADGIQEAANM